jgi:hypothetical protein
MITDDMIRDDIEHRKMIYLFLGSIRSSISNLGLVIGTVAVGFALETVWELAPTVGAMAALASAATTNFWDRSAQKGMERNLS